MRQIICPLLSTTSDSAYQECEAERCAWYVAPAPEANGASLHEGRCAIQLLGLAAPELVKEVKWV